MIFIAKTWDNIPAIGCCTIHRRRGRYFPTLQLRCIGEQLTVLNFNEICVCSSRAHWINSRRGHRSIAIHGGRTTCSSLRSRGREAYEHPPECFVHYTLFLVALLPYYLQHYIIQRSSHKMRNARYTILKKQRPERENMKWNNKLYYCTKYILSFRIVAARIVVARSGADSGAASRSLLLWKLMFISFWIIYTRSRAPCTGRLNESRQRRDRGYTSVNGIDDLCAHCRNVRYVSASTRAKRVRVECFASVHAIFAPRKNWPENYKKWRQRQQQQDLFKLQALFHRTDAQSLSFSPPPVRRCCLLFHFYY